MLEDDGTQTIIDSSDPLFVNYAEDRATTNNATCIEFDAADFNTMTFDTARIYEQVETFEHYQSSSDVEFENPVCPHRDFQAIIPFSQDVAELQLAIGQYQPTSYTSIHLGMRWATALIDPSMRPIIAATAGVDPAFAGVRPLDYTDANDAEFNVKYIVLMTDGNNVSNRRLGDTYGDDFYYRRAANGNPWDYWRNNVDSSNAANLDLLAHPSGNIPTRDDVSVYPDTAAQMDVWLQQSCTAAKNEDVVIFTIAMGASAAGEQEMRQCATSENYYFEDDGSGIGDVFDEIAALITDLRLSL